MTTTTTTTNNEREMSKVAREIRVLNRMWVAGLVTPANYAREHRELVARLRAGK